MKVRQSENGSTYPDGSVQDYYAVIHQSKRNGFPGIIVEHAFLTNASDYQKYLSSDEKLKTLGEADAKGIIEYINNNVKFGSWHQNGSQWMFAYYNGTYAKNCWEKIDGYWYHFDGNGIMQTGWLNIGGTWYYLNPSSGAMQTGWLKLGDVWYYLNPFSGAMATGWLKVGNTWYYMNPSNGAMQTGWLDLNGTKYYLKSDGAMAADTWIGDYYVNADGAWVPGKEKPVDKWINTSGRWWYRHADGSYTKSNWEYIDGQWYYFDKDGWMTIGYQAVSGEWYYLQKSASPEGALTYTGVTSIMGNSDLSSDKNTVVNKMVRMFQKSGRSYPADKLNAGGAGSIEAFCQIVYDEAVKEGVKPEIVFGQAMKETGYLQFGGAVKIEQFNFAGLGATGGSVAGAQFSNVAEGIRAQVQHLKAYASKDGLTQETVDSRFNLVTRGSAPYVEWLGQKENPNGFGWATAWNYGISMMNQYVRPMYTL